MNVQIYRQIKDMPPDEMRAFLSEKGMEASDIDDFITSFQNTKIISKEKKASVPFSESQVFKSIGERMERLKQKAKESDLRRE